jgi:hypothetical protein
MQMQKQSKNKSKSKSKNKKTLGPKRYYSHLTKKQKEQRRKEINHFKRFSWKDPKAYVGFKTDFLPEVQRKRKPSNYTLKWRQLFPEATSLKQKAEATGVPLSILEESYRRGMAAWRTGHRPGATEQQWGYARVHSLLLCGKTYYMADADLVKKNKNKKAKLWWSKC